MALRGICTTISIGLTGRRAALRIQISVVLETDRKQFLELPVAYMFWQNHMLSPLRIMSLTMGNADEVSDLDFAHDVS